MRSWLMLAVLALIAAACGASDQGAGETQTSMTGTVAVEATVDETDLAQSAPAAPAGPAGATEQTTTPAPETEPVAPEAGVAIEGPAAPDFTLTLGNGGTYTLSQGAKPVYLVFWAEW